MKAVIHHTAVFTGPDKRQLDSVNRSHKARFDFESTLGYFVGYHYFIEFSGAFVQTRSVKELGAHTFNTRLDKGYNDYIGICLAGDMNAQSPSEKQIEALRRILTIDLGIRREDVYLHRDLDDTGCPGRWITHDLIDKIYGKTKAIRAARSLLRMGNKYFAIVMKAIGREK